MRGRAAGDLHEHFSELKVLAADKQASVQNISSVGRKVRENR